MDNWRNNTIWFEEIPNSHFQQLNLKEDKLIEIKGKDIEYLILWNHKKSKLGNFVDIPESLLYLELNSSNILNFNGISKFTSLKRLELHYCIKLENDNGIAGVADSLEHLHINQSKKFVFTEELLTLKNLRVLCLNRCGSIEDLSFLKQFPNLIDFRFVDTTVLDGDLTPILEHPTIRSVGFLNKRHYNISEEKMYSLIKEKNGGRGFKTIIQKEGSKNFYTFRYNY